MPDENRLDKGDEEKVSGRRRNRKSSRGEREEETRGVRRASNSRREAVIHQNRLPLAVAFGRILGREVTRRGPLKLVSGRLSLATTLRAWRKTGANHIDNPDFDVVCKLLHRIRSRASGCRLHLR
ncbi:uncharacterized protein CIMG_10608 [Coccidioides immitis RS]|uniref:Uncharacterized protein n=1 Tax=Coccidioides immitis (strain RS) TaxID=246410 RepID=A0A0D8JSF6_COCIM|nr:uncharacterized protein CIMG_10608 [Coccidioides immitis RS]KJF60275.1 hypothetical protein CIMG_10608 [Coccidioides immitis RS]